MSLHVVYTLSTDAAKAVVRALISLRVHGLLHWCICTVCPLQSVISGAASHHREAHEHDCVTSVSLYSDLHWLPESQHTVIKLCTLVGECLRRAAPSSLG